MKTIIDISEDLFGQLFNLDAELSEDDIRELKHIIRKGTPYPQSEWIEYKTFDGTTYKIECSRCHYTVGNDYTRWNALPPYCERCGAEMKGVNNDEVD